MNIKNNIRVALMALAALTATGSLTSCSDEPDSENFYTFTGEMLSDYISKRPRYSEFKTIVERANRMDLLATYGKYTCFLPSNEAVDSFLKSRGLSSVSELSDADCDTIACTHLVANMYNTFEMNQDRLTTANMLGRYLATSQGLDEKGNAVVMIEGTAHIIFSDTIFEADGVTVSEIIHQNDSVENGIVQPVNMVIEKSNSYIADILRNNPRISYFYEALKATGVDEEISLVEDPTYSKNQPKYYYKSHVWKEVAWVPDTKKYGFTVFVEPDSIYDKKFAELGITVDSNDDNGRLKALFSLAKHYYDETYPEDAGQEFNLDNLKNDNNPLKRFVRYHILNRYLSGVVDMAPKYIDVTKECFGIDEKMINPGEWYTTLLPHTMIKTEKLTVDKDINGNDCRGADAAYVTTKNKPFFLNRRYASPEYEERGAMVDGTVETDPVHDAVNGHYYYVDDVVVFSKEVRDVVHNARIRMDFSTVFPEVITNGLRSVGNPLVDDDINTPDDSNVPKNGRNFYFPLGYLDGVTFSNCYMVLRRPHCNFWSWQGDEWNLFGDYDFTFRIPPVPFTGEWQLRLGFCALETRGVMQVYFDGVPQGIPLDMTKLLDSEMYLGDRFDGDTDFSKYNTRTDEEKAEEQKMLKNLGAYRAGRSTYHFSSGGGKTRFWGDRGTYRRILCQTHIDATKDHYVRFRVASDGKQGNNNEFMLDYFEMVPKSVYGIDSDGAIEDDL